MNVRTEAQKRLRSFTFVVMTAASLFTAVMGNDALADSPTLKHQNRKLNFNAGWQFKRSDTSGAQATQFDASDWSIVSCPHTWNDIDTFNDYGTGGHQGESNLWTGTAWTESLAKEKSTIGVSAEIENILDVASTIEVSFKLLSSDGNVVSQSKQTTKIEAGEKIKQQSMLDVNDPHLWEPDYPYVYQVQVEISIDGKVKESAGPAVAIKLTPITAPGGWRADTLTRRLWSTNFLSRLPTATTVESKSVCGK